MLSALVLIAASGSTCASRPQLKLSPVVSPVRVMRSSHAFTARAQLTLSVKTLKKPAPANDAGLRAHVAGYHAIARSLVQPSALRAMGGSEAQARERLAKAVRVLVVDANAEYVREANIYDTVTENGRAQSLGPSYGFPGGPDANVYCTR